MAILFIDLRRTWSPAAMCFTIAAGRWRRPVGTGAVGDDGLVEALLKLAAQALDAAFGFLGQLLLPGAVFDGAHGFAHLELEVFEQRGELGFKVADPIAQLDIAFAGEPGAFLVEGVLLFTRGFLLGLKLR